jgi:glycosyltransferase involved in cell wall biosynthesis
MDLRLTSSKSYHRFELKVVAIVPAYNEAPRIGGVLQILCSYPGFSDVIVVDDGSTDETAKVASAHPVTILRQRNTGKGRAMDLGVQASEADIIFFCDADVRGLTHQIIEATIKPVLDGEVDMMIAMRNRTIYIIRVILRIIPLLGGERTVTREFWEKVPSRFKSRFMIEAALNYHAYHHGNGYTYTVFPGLSQTIKEKKYGFFRGFYGRLKMLYDVVYAQILLRL